MNKFVFDTDICIYWLKGNKNIEKKVIKNGMENVFITVVTECELYYGAFKSIKREKNLEVVEELKKRIRTLHTAEGAPLFYGKIKSHLEARGRLLDDADLLIASITLANNATLVTNNTEHFKRITGLKLENWK